MHEQKVENQRTKSTKAAGKDQAFTTLKTWILCLTVEHTERCNNTNHLLNFSRSGVEFIGLMVVGAAGNTLIEWYHDMIILSKPLVGFFSLSSHLSLYYALMFVSNQSIIRLNLSFKKR